jgi:hypothetical protein
VLIPHHIKKRKEMTAVFYFFKSSYNLIWWDDGHRKGGGLEEDIIRFSRTEKKRPKEMRIAGDDVWRGGTPFSMRKWDMFCVEMTG